MFKKKLSKQGKLTVLIIALSLVVVGATVAGVVSAKYIKQIRTDGSITVSAKLAESIEVKEHQATRNTDGTYTLGTSEVTSNSYMLMPGVDIPKDPFVRVTGYTGMPAYLFVKVESTLPDNVTFAPANGWTALPDNAGVYYRELGKNSVPAQGALEIPVLAADNSGNTLTVSDKLVRPGQAYTLSFTAYIAQKVAGQTAAQAYQTASAANH
ncbi:MAG: hypothetical protein ILO42_00085 [Clostridia bacterium]|nr:hypothetical protein [Clostridia bacterium]